MLPISKQTDLDIDKNLLSVSLIKAKDLLVATKK